MEVSTYLDEAEERMDMAIMYLDESLAHIRAGIANTRILDGVKVESYGSLVALSNVATVTAPDAKTLCIKPWEKTMFREIEKALINSDIGITPENNGEVIFLRIPQMTEERRKALAKQTKQDGETAKISVRNARRDVNDLVKKAVKEGLAEDTQKAAEESAQKLHDRYIKKIDEMLFEKEKEIMKV